MALRELLLTVVNLGGSVAMPRKRKAENQDERDGNNANASHGDNIRLHNLKATALKKNLPGVRVCGISPDTGQLLAGYLNLPDTNSLRSLLTDSSMAKGPLTRWANSRKKGFGVPGKDKDSIWLKKQLWEYISRPDSLTAQELSHTLRDCCPESPLRCHEAYGQSSQCHHLCYYAV